MNDTALENVRVGTGMSGLKDALEAGKAAATAAVDPLAGEAPALVMVFATPRYDLPALLAGIRSVTGTALLIGATGSGEIIKGQYLGFGGGVGVLAMTSGPYRFEAASAGDIVGDLDKAGQTLARASRARAGSSPYAAALLITDSLLGDLQQFVQGVYRITGPKVAIVGGAAGDEQRFVQSSVFHDGAVLHKAALVLWIASERPLRVATRHGWEPIGDCRTGGTLGRGGLRGPAGPDRPTGAGSLLADVHSSSVRTHSARRHARHQGRALEDRPRNPDDPGLRPVGR